MSSSQRENFEQNVPTLSANPQERCYLYDNDELDPQYRVRFEVPT